MKSQSETLVAHLRKHKKITPVEALMQLGIYRLAARIHELRKAGVPILTIPTTQNGCTFATYKLSK